MVMTETPLEEVDDSSTTSGTSRMASSRGLVISASTRVGLAPGKNVCTLAMKGVIVGSSCRPIAENDV